MIHIFLAENNFLMFEVEFYIKINEKCISYVLIWVDDILIARNYLDTIIELKSALNDLTKMVDMEQLSWFLRIGSKIKKDCKNVSAYISKFNMPTCIPRRDHVINLLFKKTVIKC